MKNFDSANVQKFSSNYRLCAAMGEILRYCLSGIAKGAKVRESAEFWAFSCDVASAWDVLLLVKSFATSIVDFKKNSD